MPRGRYLSCTFSSNVTLRGTACLHGSFLFASKPLLVQVESGALTEVEVKRAEAAALLERRMLAMEAVLAARRSPPAQTPEPQAARGPGADLRFMVCYTLYAGTTCYLPYCFADGWPAGDEALCCKSKIS